MTRGRYSAYDRRRALSIGIPLLVLLALVGGTWLRAKALANPYALFKPISTGRARVALGGCSYRSAPNAAGFIDSFIDGAEHIGATAKVTLVRRRIAIVGWAMLANPLRPVDGIVAVVDGTCATAGDTGEDRPDVGSVLRNEAATASGFTLILDPPALPRGSHQVVVYAIDAQKRLRTQIGLRTTVTVR